MADLKSIYDLILSGQPGGGYNGIYKPSPPVMLPPQGMGSNQALGAALSDPTGMGPDSGALSGMLDDPIYSGAAPFSGGAGVPHANGTLVAQKDTSRLAPSPAGNLFAYGEPSTTAPTSGAASAIASILVRGSSLPPPPRRDPRGSRAAFLSGNPGQTDWNVANQGMGGLRGPVNQRSLGAPPPTRGLGAVGNPAVFSQPTQPAVSHYQTALNTAAQKYNTTPEAIHQQLMAQQRAAPSVAQPGVDPLTQKAQDYQRANGGQSYDRASDPSWNPAITSQRNN